MYLTPFELSLLYNYCSKGLYYVRPHPNLKPMGCAHMIKLLNWNVKLWAAVAAIIIVLAGAGVLLSNHNESQDDTAIVLARANTEGSGIFGDDPNMVTIENGKAVFHAEYWEGKTIATPGATSIQHLYITQIVNNMGLQTRPYDAATPCPDGTVYLKESTITNMPAEFSAGTIDGGIAWEAVYTQTVSTTSAVGLCTTQQISGYEGHACCMVAANSSYLEDNQEIVIRFLAGYMEAVDYINSAKTAGTGSESYEEIIRMAVSFTGYNDAVVRQAMSNVTYTYDLTNFADEFAGLIDSYIAAGNITQDAMDRIGQTPEQFAQNHIDFNVLNTAKQIHAGSYDTATVKVAYLAADIHQFALIVGIEKGFFADYGINIERVGPYSAGGQIMTAVLTGEADIGFAGAPPIVLNTVNMAAS